CVFECVSWWLSVCMCVCVCVCVCVSCCYVCERRGYVCERGWVMCVCVWCVRVCVCVSCCYVCERMGYVCEKGWVTCVREDEQPQVQILHPGARERCVAQLSSDHPSPGEAWRSVCAPGRRAPRCHC